MSFAFRASERGVVFPPLSCMCLYGGELELMPDPLRIAETDIAQKTYPSDLHLN